MDTSISHSNIYHNKHQRFTGNAPDRKMPKESLRASKTDYSQGATATNIRMNKSAQVNFGGFFNGEKLAQNPTFHKILKAPGNDSAVFESTFALLITCLMRPATIMATPGSKKEDKQCASVQSMASGVIDFIMTSTLLKPINKAIKDLQKDMNNDPAKYYKDIDHDVNSNPDKHLSILHENIKKGPEDFLKYFEDDAIANPHKFFTGAAKGVDEKKEVFMKRVMKEVTEKPEVFLNTVKKGIVEDTQKYLKISKQELMAKPLKNMDFIFNYGSKTLMIPLRSFLTIALIPPTLKLLFPNRKGKKEQEEYHQTNYNIYFKNKQINNKVFANFLGVNK